MKKTVLITGASSGIGKATAYEFASHGYNLILVARRISNLEQIKADILDKYNVEINVFGKDLSELKSAEELYQTIMDKNLNPDILINNAGFGLKGNFMEIDENKEEEMLVLNMVTLTKLCRLFGKHFKNTGGGSIINISSTAAFQAVPNLSTYSATKAYVLSLSEALAYEFKKYNINVVAICPGATESEFAQVAGFEETKFMQNIPTSADLARFIYDNHLKNCPVKIHGWKNQLMVWSGRFAPRQMVINIAAKMMK